MTPSGIEPTTCWFVSLCLNHYATALHRSEIHVTENYMDALELLNQFLSRCHPKSEARKNGGKKYQKYIVIVSNYNILFSDTSGI